MEGRLGISWGLSSVHGWGVFGLNLVRVLLRNAGPGIPRPLLLNGTLLANIDPKSHPMLADLIGEHERLVAGSKHLARVGLNDTLVLHSSGNGLLHSEISGRYSGTRNYGFTFFEETGIAENAIAAVKSFDGMRTGSNWNRDYLISRGVGNTVCVHQGVDTETFKPGTKTDRFKGRFVVFGGGKLEFRKGQDIVIAAFRAFHQRHPDALLLTVWQNPWPDSILSMHESPHIKSLPEPGPSLHTFPRWTRGEGLPEGAHVDAGAIANADLPLVLREADAAVFANRCEGGTNLAAMECMASGLPCVMSMNTGHLDIAHDGNCYPLHRQSPVADPHGTRAGWGESDVDEIVERLEEIYGDREAAKARGGAARDTMSGMTWDNQIARLIETFG